MHFAERVRHRIEQRFAAGGQTGITASLGVAEFSPDTSTPRTLVEAADAAMYESKHAGRNRVALSSTPPCSAAVPSPDPQRRPSSAAPRRLYRASTPPGAAPGESPGVRPAGIQNGGAAGPPPLVATALVATA
jgi:hypothetical protein